MIPLISSGKSQKITSNRRKAVTMRDIAEDAHVSITTVSHVVNNTATISDATAERVRCSIRKLGYKPLPSAEFNRGQRLIAVFIPDLRNEFYAKSVQAIFDAAWQHDYGIVVCDLKHSHQAESQYLRNLLHQNICGIIFFGGISDLEQQIRNISKKVPVVLGDMQLPKGFPKSVDAICSNNDQIMCSTITRLARAGYTKIGYISEDFLLTNSRDRFNGYKEGLEKNGLPYQKQWVFISERLRLNKIDSSYHFFSAILQHGIVLPQILLCSSDLIAIGIIGALKKHGYHIPRDIGVIGFDDISVAPYVDPPLTTVAQNMEQMGSRCFACLLNRIEHPERPPQEIAIRSKLIIRNSVKL